MSPRSLLEFFGRFFALLLIFSLIWYWLALFYAGILVGLGNGTLRTLGYSPMLSLHDRQITLTVISQNVQISTEISSFYGVPLLVALIWAAPALSARARRRLSLLGLSAMTFAHWLNLISQAGMLLAPAAWGKFFSERLFLMSALGDMLLPAAFALGLALRRSPFRRYKHEAPVAGVRP